MQRDDMIRPLVGPEGPSLSTLETLVQSRRNAKAAKRFMRKLMKRWGILRVIITDKLRSYGFATRELCPGVDHRSHKGLNNRSEASHRYTRRREKIFGRFRSARQAQMFLSVHDQTAALFFPKRHGLNASDYRRTRTNAHGLWVGYLGETVGGSIVNIGSIAGNRPDYGLPLYSASKAWVHGFSKAMDTLLVAW
jgi:NAD(P)-dependent dehydrogenase (short-subunit alcohol dehydrogenase family)